MTRLLRTIALTLVASSFSPFLYAQTTLEWVVLMRGNSASADFRSVVAEAGGQVTYAHEGAGIAVVTASPEQASLIGRSSDVLAIEQDTSFQLAPAAAGEEIETYGDATSVSNPATAFFYPRQWHLRAIGADVAWTAGKLGNPAVTVAILDTGIDYSHPDLVGKVDLSRSRSFVASDDAVVAAQFPGKHPVTDLHFHGTHVAATVSSNAIAAAGVTSRTTLIGVKVLSRTGSGNLSWILGGILHATDAGADVINMSLGGGFSKAGNGRYVALIQRAMNYAYRHGSLVVVAAGNERHDLDHDGNLLKTYCGTANVVCVSATGPTSRSSINGPWQNVDAIASYSNFGRSSISVAAPGGNSGGAVAAACSRTSLLFPVCRTGTFILNANGTSMAAPHVSGLAALLVSELGFDRPAQVRATLIQSADDVGTPGTDPYYGKGRINIPRALGLQ